MILKKVLRTLRKVVNKFPLLETRVKDAASRDGFAAALEQLTVDGRKPKAFTSKFQISCEES